MAESASSVVTYDDVQEMTRNLIVDFVRESSEILLEELEKKKLWAREWINRRETRGASVQLLTELRNEDPAEYRACMRMSPESFDVLLELIKPVITKQDTNMRPALSAKLKLEITLSYLATGNSYRSLQHLFRVSKAAMSVFIPEVCVALYTCLKEYIKTPESHEAWMIIGKGFRDCWNFPGCYGAIDGKHITIRAPNNCGSTYFNYKKSHSIILLALVDHDYCFTYIDVGSNGSVSDARVFQRCSLLDSLESGLLPKDGVVLGDDAFPLKEYLMKPYGGQLLDMESKIYNYRLSRARRIVENAFGILVSRFRVFERPIQIDPESVDKIVFASCALHNFLRKLSNHTYFPRGAVDIEDYNLGDILAGSWRQETIGLPSVTRIGSQQQTKKAKNKRDAYKRYFVNEGAVHWQYKMLH